MSTYKSVISLLATMSLGFVSLTQASEIDILTANILQNANHSTIDMLILESVGLLDIKQYGHSNQIEANVSDSVSRIDLNQSGDDNILNMNSSTRDTAALLL